MPTQRISRCSRFTITMILRLLLIILVDRCFHSTCFRQPFEVQIRTPVAMMRGVQPMSTELQDFLQNAGIRSDHPIIAYLTHIGLTSEIAFVEFKPNTVELSAWCDKFRTEVKFGENKIGPMEGDQLEVLKASLIATHKAINKHIGTTISATPTVTDHYHTQRTRR